MNWTILWRNPNDSREKFGLARKYFVIQKFCIHWTGNVIFSSICRTGCYVTSLLLYSYQYLNTTFILGTHFLSNFPIFFSIHSKNIHKNRTSASFSIGIRHIGINFQILILMNILASAFYSKPFWRIVFVNRFSRCKSHSLHLNKNDRADEFFFAVFRLNFRFWRSKNKMPKEETREELEKQLPFCAPFDPRFPNTNQTRYCTQSFIDFYRCQKLRGKDYEPCFYFQKVFHNICPNAWVEKWQEQMSNGSFPVEI